MEGFFKMKTILVDAADTFVVDRKIFQEMYKLLEKYPNKKLILTNANDENKVKFGIIDMPYEVFTLENNPSKKDLNYFEIMLKHFNLSKEEVVYFEHNMAAVESAKSVGITSYYYDETKKDLVALKEFLDNNL